MSNIKVITDKDQLSQQNITEFKALLYQCEYAYTDDVGEYIDFNNGKLLIASFDNQNHMNGFASIEDECDELYVSLVFVDRNSRHRGVGSALLDSVQNYAKASGYEKIYLIVNRKNENAKNLYTKKDYICVKSNDNYVSFFMYKYADDFLQAMGQFIDRCCEFDNHGFLIDINKAKSITFAKENRFNLNKLLKSKEFYSCKKILSKIDKDKLNENTIYYFNHIAHDRDYEDFYYSKLCENFPNLSSCNKEDFKNAHIPLGAFYCYQCEDKINKMDFDKQSIESFFENKI